MIVKEKAALISELERRWVIEIGSRYWPEGRGAISSLPIPCIMGPFSGRLLEVDLPFWARNLGPGSPDKLLVDESCFVDIDANITYDRCDWVRAAFLHLTGAAERQKLGRDIKHHSYFFRIKGLDGRLYDRAWVNWIFLFLRRWAAYRSGTNEIVLFGELPQARIDLTHDVDAIHKTLEIRLKQGAFNVFNALRCVIKGDWGGAFRRLNDARRFLITHSNFWTFSEIRRMEEAAGLRSTFHFYGGPRGVLRLSPLSILLDPAYDISDMNLREELSYMISGGWKIGLHQRFSSWSDAEHMSIEKEKVQQACGVSVTKCRQHWLQFSWDHTWKAQMEAGLKLDSTLGFNDRPAFRNGAALAFNPWNDVEQRAMSICALPMVFMDSHFYDYAQFSDYSRREAMKHWIDEIWAVRGEASICWHTHTITDDYGWKNGFQELLEILKYRNKF